MLKTLSPTPDEARDDTTAETDNSERRMRRALEALSGPARPDAPQPDIRTDGGFRQDRGFDRGAGQRRDLRDSPASYAAKARHRFVKDGEVPVVHLAAPRPRDPAAPAEPDLARLKDIIEDQRVRLEQAERAGREIQAQLRALQTKCAHTEMALNDATALAESRLHELEALREGVLREGVRRADEPTPRAASPEPAMPRRRGRPPGRTAAAPVVVVAPEHEPEPVQWWLQPPKSAAKSRRRV